MALLAAYPEICLRDDRTFEVEFFGSRFEVIAADAARLMIRVLLCFACFCLVVLVALSSVVFWFILWGSSSCCWRFFQGRALCSDSSCWSIYWPLFSEVASPCFCFTQSSVKFICLLFESALVRICFSTILTRFYSFSFFLRFDLITSLLKICHIIVKFILNFFHNFCFFKISFPLLTMKMQISTIVEFLSLQEKFNIY